jgi:cell wall-associated NlpC family hydrolase
MLTTLNPGDVVAVDTGDALQDDLIRLGGLLKGEPSPANHVVIVHHRDKAGTLWGIEGRPGGVGYVDMAKYLREPLVKYGNSNTALARTAQQSAAICEAALSLLGTPYDWTGGIAADALGSLPYLKELSGLLDKLWGWKDGSNLRPAHVVCSSLAQWVYAHLGLPCPEVRDAELCTPADWWAYNAAIG